MPDLGIVICASPRTGSYLLCDLMQQAGLGRPHEVALPDDEPLWSATLGFKDYGQYVREVFRLYAHNGTFAAKSMWFQFRCLNQIARENGAVSFETYRSWERLVGKSHYVRLVRLDLIGQIISWLRARESGIYNIRANRTVLVSDCWSERSVCEAIRFFEDELRGWRDFFDFHHVSSTTVYSENLFATAQLVLSEVLSSVGRTDRPCPMVRTKPVRWTSSVEQVYLRDRVRRLIRLNSPFLYQQAGLGEPTQLMPSVI